MLPPHPLHTRLTSCACLLRLWEDEIVEEMMERQDEGLSATFLPRSWEAGVVSGICDCLQAGLQVSFIEVPQPGLHQTSVVVLSKCQMLWYRCLSVTAMPACTIGGPDAARCSHVQGRAICPYTCCHVNHWRNCKVVPWLEGWPCICALRDLIPPDSHTMLSESGKVWKAVCDLQAVMAIEGQEVSLEARPVLSCLFLKQPQVPPTSIC